LSWLLNAWNICRWTLNNQQPVFAFCSKHVLWTSHLLLFPNRMVMHIVMLKKYFIEIDLFVMDSYMKDAFFKYVILHQKCVYTAVSIVHVSIKLSLIIIIIFVLKKIDVIFVKLFGFFFSWQITCCISGNWYSMSNDCHIYWWEFNYLKSIKSRIFKEWSHLIFSKRVFWKISKPCWKYYVNCLLMTKNGFGSQLTHVSLCLTMALCVLSNI